MQALLLDGGDPSFVNAVNLAETLDTLVRVKRVDEDDALERLRWLGVGGMAVVDVDERLGLLAGRLRTRHYRRRSSEVSMADCLVLATAIVQSDRLATADPALAAMARAEGVDVVALPDSSGRGP